MKKLILSNTHALGTHENNITLQTSSDTTVASKYLLGTINGSGEVSVCGATHLPIGIITDEAGPGEFVNVALLGGSTTLNGVASGTINVGDRLIPADNGKIAATSSSTSSMIGIALTKASAADEMIEFISCLPQSYTAPAVPND